MLHGCCAAAQVSVEDIIADGKLRLAVQPVFDETQLAAALQVLRCTLLPKKSRNHMQYLASCLQPWRICQIHNAMSCWKRSQHSRSFYLGAELTLVPLSACKARLATKTCQQLHVNNCMSDGCQSDAYCYLDNALLTLQGDRS